MADPTPAKISIPHISSGVWWTVRQRFNRSMPGNVDNAYLSSILGGKESSARVYRNKLISMGLVDRDTGKPTPLANKWRDDDSYQAACHEILDYAAPKELLSAFPPTDQPEFETIKRWFKNKAEMGENAAASSASFYILLADADLTQKEEGTKRTTTKTATPKVATKKPTPQSKPRHPHLSKTVPVIPAALN